MIIFPNARVMQNVKGFIILLFLSLPHECHDYYHFCSKFSLKKANKMREREMKGRSTENFCIIIKQHTTAFYHHLQQQNTAGFFFIDTETNKHGPNKHFSTFAHNKQFKVPPPPLILSLSSLQVSSSIQEIKKDIHNIYIYRQTNSNSHEVSFLFVISKSRAEGSDLFTTLSDCKNRMPHLSHLISLLVCFSAS